MKTFPQRRLKPALERGLVSACALAMLGTGCATPTVLKPEDRVKVTQTQVRAYLPQKELKAEYIATSGASAAAPPILAVFGILAATAYNAAAARDANVSAEPLRVATKDLDVRSLYWQAISNAISASSWLKVASFQTFAAAPRSPRKKELATNAVLNIETEYSLKPDGRLLFIRTKLEFYAPGNSSRLAAANVMTWSSADIGEVPRADAIGLWATNNGAAFREAVSDAVAANAKLIQYVLEEMGGITNAAARPAEVQSGLPPFHQGNVVPFIRKAQVLEETPDRLIFKAWNGAFFSFPRQEVELTYVVENSPDAR